jgi:hypothetical protein
MLEEVKLWRKPPSAKLLPRHWLVLATGSWEVVFETWSKRTRILTLYKGLVVYKMESPPLGKLERL